MRTAPVFLVAALPAGTTHLLDGEEGHHAATVRRLAAGEEVDLADGAGGLAHCVVTGVGRGRLELAVTGRTAVPAPSPRLVVAQALAKGDRGELAVETMTEAGVDEIVPWQAARSVVRWQGERGAKSLGRWRSTAREAAKQARRAWLPAVTEPVTTAALAGRLSAAHLAVVLDGDGPTPLGDLVPPEAGEVVVVVGPEGGVAPDELAAFLEAGAVPARLGPTVLRTSTAGVVAAAILSTRTRWR
jgi:16S rRNA (uracil1498-N3)-methyltransferase